MPLSFSVGCIIRSHVQIHIHFQINLNTIQTHHAQWEGIHKLDSTYILLLLRCMPSYECKLYKNLRYCLGMHLRLLVGYIILKCYLTFDYLNHREIFTNENITFCFDYWHLKSQCIYSKCVRVCLYAYNLNQFFIPFVY